MDDSLNSSQLNRSSEVTSAIPGKKVYKGSLVASCRRASPQNAFRHIASVSHGIIGNGAVGHAAVFLLKVAALETVRRISMAKCPFAWHGIQALQILCCPPFKWIQRWAPFKGLVEGVQALSRPILVLSIATAFSDQSECSSGTSDGVSDSHTCSEQSSEQSSVQPNLDTRTSDGSPQSEASETWLIQLYKELKIQGITLPERINEDELRRFYSTTNGDFTCFLSSIKKTIRWRETYGILSAQELEVWSDMVFWHGFDVQQRPCLIVRLGLACVTLQSQDKPRFAQAVISQVEHGVLHLVDAENSYITVLVDCEGLSPLKIPMQMMRSCSSLLQDHFPNRLGCLFVIRLPPVVRVIAQTFIQVLKPTTRKKLKIVGEMYNKVLSEYLQTPPSYLGGKCTCAKCSTISIRFRQQHHSNRMNKFEPNLLSDGEGPAAPYPADDIDIGLNSNFDQVLRTAIISILMVWVFIAVIAGLYDTESRPFPP
ncbi:phosphatidylinositol/phosphatidylcholine transfer protein sfh2 [Fagus crenata]